MKRPTYKQTREAAKRLFHDEGVLEIDDDAKVSRSVDMVAENGAYVAAWVWVYDAAVGIEFEKED